MKARLISKRGRVREVRQRWYEQYRHYIDAAVPPPYAEDKKATYERLLALDLDTVSPSEVDRIIGNTSWTDLRCDGCETYGHEQVVEVGEASDYETATAKLCAACVAEAAHVADWTVS